MNENLSNQILTAQTLHAFKTNKYNTISCRNKNIVVRNKTYVKFKFNVVLKFAHFLFIVNNYCFDTNSKDDYSLTNKTNY
jgi:hypothetical protein